MVDERVLYSHACRAEHDEMPATDCAERCVNVGGWKTKRMVPSVSSVGIQSCAWKWQHEIE